MNNVKLSHRIVILNIAIAVIITIILSLTGGGFHNANDFAFALGIVCLGSGSVNLVLGLVFLAVDNKEWRSGFFLSSGALFLLSGISCGGGAVL